MFAKSALVAATAAAIALTSLDLRPVQAAPLSGIAKSNADEFSGARKRRRGGHHGAPLAAFGAIVGTIAGIAAAQRQREYYEQPYYAPYGYYAPHGYSGFAGPTYYGGHGYQAYQYRLGPPAPPNDHPGY
jgi:hypothetical protein